MLLLSLAISFLSCGDDDEQKPGPNGPEQEVGDNTGEISFTGGVETLYITGAEVTGYLNVSDAVLANTTYGIVYSTSAGTDIDNCDGCLSTTSIEDKKYNVTISGLEANTKYYYRSYARIGNNYVYGSERLFTTNSVTTKAALTAQEGLSATFSCTTNLDEFDLQNGSNEYGLVWGTSADVGYDNAEGHLSASEVENGSYTINVNELKYSTKYYYRAYTRTGRKYTYSNVLSFTTDEGPTTQGIDNGHTWVDLELPSGLKWATMNVGATTPEDHGDYFAWGETEPKDKYEIKNYKWATDGTRSEKGGWTGLTKYTFADNDPSGIWYDNGNFVGDNKTTLEPEDDAAHVNWGGNWRTPTKKELEELCNTDNCTWTGVTQNGVDGMLVTSKKNGNTIFLPCTGYRSGSRTTMRSEGYYQSSTLDDCFSNSITILHFTGRYTFWYRDNRFNGHTIRAVCQ